MEFSHLADGSNPPRNSGHWILVGLPGWRAHWFPRGILWGEDTSSAFSRTLQYPMHLFIWLFLICIIYNKAVVIGRAVS